MIDKAGAKTTRIAIGNARLSDREPSHDGEYVTLYYVAGDDEWLLENNAGVCATSGDQYPRGTEDDDLWVGIINEAEENTKRDRGTSATTCGSEASSMMEEMGWLAIDPEWPEERNAITR